MRGLTALTELLERTTAALLALSIVAGSLFLWIGIPVLGLWVAGQLTETTTSFLFAALAGVPLAMMVTGWALFAVGARYERLRHRGYGTPPPRRQSAWLVAQSGERATSRRSRMGSSLVEVCMAGSATLAVVLLLVWFFFIAEMKLAPMQ